MKMEAVCTSETPVPPTRLLNHKLEAARLFRNISTQLPD
jgi:hypothetical protein